MRVRHGLVPLFVLAAMAVAPPAVADVTARSEAGFSTTASVVVAAEPAEVWATLIEPGSWWSKDHSWFGEEGRFSLAPVAGGCFCETSADGEASAEHMRVLFAIPGRQLRLRGSLGPLQAEALTGVLTVSLEPAREGTRVTWDYVVSGFARFPLEQVASVVDGVLAEQLNRLQAFVETGAPTAN